MFKVSNKPILKDEEIAETTLIDKLLADQKKLTAVERFSQKHESLSTPAQEPHYKDLIPIRKPSSGEQYSFAVDLDKCTGCKACVVSCHNRNGLDENESWRDIGKIRSNSTHEQQIVTTACHHCADPGCLTGCPVGAYEKMPDTGIVRHLDDQCIGCEYCSLKCPYDVPKYNEDLGIVRKCDMCHDRLEEGEAPACVQSCPNGAIKIELVTTEEIYDRAKEQESIIAGAYRSDYTYPSTRYTTKRELPADMEAVDKESLEASHKHTPLSWMLMLTQASVGVSVIEFIVRLIQPNLSLGVALPMIVLAVLLGMVGLIVSVFHLGSPLGAWRIFLGLKTSWLSREAVLFGMWMPVLQMYAGLAFAQHFSEKLPDWVPTIENWMLYATGSGAAILGLISIFCSIMVYVDTKRAFWSLPKTTAKFAGTMIISGTVILLVVANAFSDVSAIWLWGLAVLGILIKCAVEMVSLLPAKQKEWSTHKKSALIQLVTLKKTLTSRWFFLALSAVFMTLSNVHVGFSALAILTLLFGEWLERQIFFQAVETLKMPGNLKRS